MTIEILPARLANQIAAGEVVERPASVVKELVENALDAGATSIQIDIEKGGAKRIRITDNGCGIVKDELTLALSRHATSKIKNLDDLEAISSLGFRGEALASISSVARLTLTSKPADQSEAWQAHAEGRDMQVIVQPAAHPDGTTIDVSDLFFNTPARRKFLRTEKTEFAHIEEVFKRIALAHFDIAFTLTHNGKVVKKLRALQQPELYIKRIGQICGQSFVDNAVAVDCQHDDIKLSGWIAKPSFTRAQNDLCYSYVNERMMRDKLINHAIRQAYGEFIGNDVYPAFVLYLSVDFKEVDVNVHPAKHEVRFHQGRYVHDFIYSVCHKALVEQLEFEPQPVVSDVQSAEYLTEQHQDFIQPLRAANELNQSSGYQASLAQGNHSHYSAAPSFKEQTNYHALISPSAEETSTETNSEVAVQSTIQAESLKPANSSGIKLLSVIEDKFGLIKLDDELRLVKLTSLAHQVNLQKIAEAWQSGLTAQPLLLPVRIKVSSEQMVMLSQFQQVLQQTGIDLNLTSGFVQVKEFPALLRQADVTSCMTKVINFLPNFNGDIESWQQFIAELACPTSYDLVAANQLWITAELQQKNKFSQLIRLNSAIIDLTSSIKHLS